jgi:metallo-beta-lactamase class B
MTKAMDWALAGCIAFGVLACTAVAQDQPRTEAPPAAQPQAGPQGSNAPAKPDSPEVLAHIAKAKEIAGTFWAREEYVLCEDFRVPSAPDPGPAKLFDNLYTIPGQYGGGNGVVYVLSTSDGLMLIDSGYQDDAETVLLPGLKTLGFDPANIKVIILTHGHPDHYGGATYLQNHYSGIHIYMSAADWDFALKPFPARPGRSPGVPPKKDMVAVEGQPIVLGEEKVTPIFIPGHTPGSLGLIFPVKEGAQTHVAAIVGGGFTAPGQPDQAREFIQSLDHFGQSTEKMDADVELQNHPIMDNFGQKLAALKDRKPGQPNPFVVGRDNYTKFLEVMSECAKASLARHAE